MIFSRYFATYGKTASNTNDAIRAGDNNPLSESSLASCVPALMKTIVPGAIPINDAKKKTEGLIEVSPSGD